MAVTNGIDEAADFIVNVLCREEAQRVAEFLVRATPSLADQPFEAAMEQSKELVLRQTKLRVFEHRRYQLPQN
ncbi:MAG: hypothetical protein AAF556_10255 [Pseudomonadota bacterium]